MTSNLADIVGDDAAQAAQAKAQGQIDEKIKKLVSEYAASEVRSGNENTIRANIRETIEKLGFHPKAFQDEVRTLKTYTPGERADYDRSRQRMRNILEPEQESLFPDHVAAARKREERQREAERKAAEEQAQSQRGDPSKGGAGGVDGHAPAKDAAPKSKRKEKNVKAPAKSAAKPKAKSNVVPMTARKAAGKAAAEGDAAIKEAIARQAQNAAGQPGDGTTADLHQQEQEEGNELLNEQLPQTKNPPTSPPPAPTTH